MFEHKTQRDMDTNRPNCINCKARAHSIFSEAGSNELQALDEAKRCQTFKKGQTIFEEDTYPHGLYCINNGKVKVVKNGIDGKEQIMHLAKNGDVMGYRAIFSGDKYSCSAVALETSNVCFIPVNTFKAMVERDAKLALRMIQLFANELKNAECSITDMAQKTVKERLAQGILLLKESYGYEKDGCTINVSITREEIAGIVGTARETATRLLAELNKEKSIELVGKRIKIINHEKLVREANMFD